MQILSVDLYLQNLPALVANQSRQQTKRNFELSNYDLDELDVAVFQDNQNPVNDLAKYCQHKLYERCD